MNMDKKDFCVISCDLKQLVEKDDIDGLFREFKKYSIPDLYIVEAVRTNDDNVHVTMTKTVYQR